MVDLHKLAEKGRVLKIAQMGHPILFQKAEAIDPTSEEAHQITYDMAATLLDYGEVGGLAAPQVFISKRIVFYNVPKTRVDEYTPEGLPMTIIANPSYEPLTNEKVTSWEACLSLSEMAGEVSRYKGIKYTFQTLQGDWKTEEAWGIHAKVLQHEIDHLDGILYPMRMQDMSRFGSLKEVLRYMRKE